MTDWDGPIQLDPIVDEWGSGGNPFTVTGPYDEEMPKLVGPPPPDDPPEPPPEIIEEEHYHEPMSITRIIWYAIFAASIALILLVLWAWVQIRQHIHATHGTTHGTASGNVFAFLVVAAVLFIGLPALFRWLLGRD